MGNANGREEGEIGTEDPRRSDVEFGFSESSFREGISSVDYMGSTPPESPGRSRSPVLFAPQVPVAPLQRPSDSSSIFNEMWMINEAQNRYDLSQEKGIPTLITWNHGGKDVAVQGSWDNWTSRKTLQRSGKDYTILLVLPSGVYQYKFIVDGECRFIPDLPSLVDEMGGLSNLLDVNDCVPASLESVAEFEPPPSPDSSYGQPLQLDEDFSKEPPSVPPHLHLTILGMPNSTSKTDLMPQHVVLDHLFIEKGWTSQSLVALGLTHRYQSKHVTIALYKPIRR